MVIVPLSSAFELYNINAKLAGCCHLLLGDMITTLDFLGALFIFESYSIGTEE